jgi:hypothetical protein
MANINAHGMARAFPQYKLDVDYHLVDFHDGNGVQLVWLHEHDPTPDLNSIEAETAVWQAEQDAIAYRDKRVAEYPPMQDYIDAQVKKASSDPAVREAGLAQEASYISACAAIKTKYPKGESK